MERPSFAQAHSLLFRPPGWSGVLPHSLPEALALLSSHTGSVLRSLGLGREAWEDPEPQEVEVLRRATPEGVLARWVGELEEALAKPVSLWPLADESTLIPPLLSLLLEEALRRGRPSVPFLLSFLTAPKSLLLPQAEEALLREVRRRKGELKASPWWEALLEWVWTYDQEAYPTPGRRLLTPLARLVRLRLEDLLLADEERVRAFLKEAWGEVYERVVRQGEFPPEALGPLVPYAPPSGRYGLKGRPPLPFAAFHLRHLQAIAQKRRGRLVALEAAYHLLARRKERLGRLLEGRGLLEGSREARAETLLLASWELGGARRLRRVEGGLYLLEGGRQGLKALMARRPIYLQAAQGEGLKEALARHFGLPQETVEALLGLSRERLLEGLSLMAEGRPAQALAVLGWEGPWAEALLAQAVVGL